MRSGGRSHSQAMADMVDGLLEVPPPPYHLPRPMSGVWAWLASGQLMVDGLLEAPPPPMSA